MSSSCRASTVRAICSLLLGCLSTFDGLQAYQPAAIDPGLMRAAQPALGINDVFGRWTTRVRLVYDPDDAPAAFPPAKFLSLLANATSQWERVSGIRFEVTGTDASAPDDASLPTAQRDGLVRIFWGQTGGFAGLAGPEFGSFDQALGYFPYHDGDIKLNRDPASWESEEELVHTLAHELGHLIGLGHSENPVSMMYANPYNNLNFPREDDIRAVQALYGAGTGGVTPEKGVSEWKYSVPAAAAASVTQFLFKPNEVATTGAFLSLQSAPGTAITTLGSSAADGQLLRINAGGIGGFTNTADINIKAHVMVVDPDGYLWDDFDWQLQCNARFACSGGALGFIRTDILKTYAGTWRFYVVDTANNTLLLTQSLAVTAETIVNKPPRATVSAVQGATPAQVTITLAVTDSEGDDVTVTWHGPGQPLDRNNDGFNDGGFIEPVGSDGIAVHTIDYSQAGTYTLFVGLRDDSVRYGSSANGSSAGDGFSNLLRLRVILPLSGINGGVTLEAAQHGAPVPVSPVLSTIAAARDFASVSTAGVTSARYTMGASKDNGLSTATGFRSGDSILVAGAVKAQAADVGRAADIFVVIRAVIGASESWLYRDADGAFRPWSGAITDLRPAQQTSSLESSTVVEVYRGPVGVGTFQVFLGYKLDSSTTLHYTNGFLNLDVVN